MENLLLHQSTFFPTFTGICRIDVNRNLGPVQPLLIVPGQAQFFNPSNTRGHIQLNRNEEIEVFCTNGFSYPPIKKNSLKFSCVTRQSFQLDNRRYEFNEINCKELPSHVARRIPGQRCFDNGTLVEVGFDLGSRFLQIFTLCHDEILERTHYVKHFMKPANSGFQRGFQRTEFIQSDFFGSKDISRLFSRSTQRITIGNLLGSRNLARTYIHDTGDMFIARGHLAARADFIFGNQQLATFYYVNAAPQWQYFNGHNWEAVESSVRTLVGAKNLSLEIYTGTYGITSLKDIRGIPRELFMHVDGNEKTIPVPRLYYKILINKASSSGIVLIGVNNPHLTIEDIKKDYIICNDVSDKITNINWKRDDIQRGFSYACTVKEFLTRIPHVAIKNINKLLIF